MATVTYGGGVASFKGSIAGLTFQQNRSGSIVRSRPSTYKSITQKQSGEINSFFRFKNLWQNLSQANIDLWNTFADTYTKENMWGTTKTLSGINWFSSINYYRVLTNNSILSSPPTYASAISIPSFTFAVKNDRLALLFTTSWGTSADNLIIYTSYPLLNKQSDTRSGLRLTKIIDNGPFISLDLTTEWEATHSLSYPPGQAHPDFFVNIALRSSKNTACIPGPASFVVTQFDDNPGGIGFMIIGDSFIIS